MSTLKKLLPLSGAVMNYAWGERGAESLVYQLLENSRRAESDEPYAELWFGAHPSAPAVVTHSGATLDQLISEYPDEILGQRVAEEFHDTLPFLFKVLSVRTALSIQAHPNMKLAQQLHEEDPIHYPDPRHKPEIAIALSNVSLLYGFRSLDDIARDLQKRISISSLLSLETQDELFSGVTLDSGGLLRRVYSEVCRTNRKKVRQHTAMLLQELAMSQELSEPEEWLLHLAADFPEGDVGLFSFYLLNYCTLHPGEAIFIEAGLPHAYLQGNLIECMANSDNVVRGGLTTKFCDLPVLLDMLNYSWQAHSSAPDFHLALSTPAAHGHGTSFSTAAREFQLEAISGRNVNIDLPTDDSAQLIFCLDATGQIVCGDEQLQLEKGTACLVPAAASRFSLRDLTGTVFRAFVP